MTMTLQRELTEFFDTNTNNEVPADDWKFNITCTTEDLSEIAFYAHFYWEHSSSDNDDDNNLFRDKALKLQHDIKKALADFEHEKQEQERIDGELKQKRLEKQLKQKQKKGGLNK